MNFFVCFLLFIIPGFIAGITYYTLCCKHSKHHKEPKDIVITSLIFDLLIFIVNITGLYYLKGIHTYDVLEWYFTCLSFTRKYALLSILVGIVLAIIACAIKRLCNHCCRKK